MNIELIHKYIVGGLAGDELQAFERKLSSDQELRTEVLLQKQMLDHLDVIDSTSEARSAISEVHNEYNNEMPDHSNRRWLVVGFIFIIMLLLLLLFRMLSNVNDQSKDALQFADVPTLPEASFITKGSSADDLAIEASTAYNKEEYERAIGLFDQALTIGSANDGELLFYKGLSLLGLKRYDEAITTFSILKEDYSLFEIDADWYRAMALWYSGDRTAAGVLLRSFTSGNYQKKAQPYLQSIE